MRRQHSRSAVFLIEILLALLIFALCSSVCAGLLVRAYRLSKESGSLNQAVIAAQSGAEAFKNRPGVHDLALSLEGVAEDGVCYVYYDEGWLPTTAPEAAYIMRIAPEQQDDLQVAEILVSDRQAREIFRLEATLWTGEGAS